MEVLVLDKKIAKLKYSNIFKLVMLLAYKIRSSGFDLSGYGLNKVIWVI